MGDGALWGLLVTLLIMPMAGAKSCRLGEYLYEGRCCLSCPAGTYVAQHCPAPYSRGRCALCIEGESYTAHENGLEACLPCRECKEDQITLRPCTLTSDAECQCKQGYFCPAGGCEICQKCSTVCPEGKEIVQNCNATTDLECGLLNQGRIDVWITVIILVAVALLLFLVIQKLRNNKATSTDNKDAEKGLEPKGSAEHLILPEARTLADKTTSPEDKNSDESPEGQAQSDVPSEVNIISPEENNVVFSAWGTILRGGWRNHMEECWRRITESSLPTKTGAFHPNAPFKIPSGRVPANHMAQEPNCRIIVKDLSQKELRDCFGTFIKEVPPKKWKQFMRTHLQENDIVKITYDFPNDVEEQSYQMLLTWKNTLGEKQSIIKLLDELRNLDTKAYDNVLNTLKSSNIISKLEATD